MRKSKYKKILNTEHKFATLYVINSAQNIFIYYSVQYFTLKKLNLLGLIILPDPEKYQIVRYQADTGYRCCVTRTALIKHIPLLLFCFLQVILMELRDVHLHHNFRLNMVTNLMLARLRHLTHTEECSSPEQEVSHQAQCPVGQDRRQVVTELLLPVLFIEIWRMYIISVPDVM